MKYSSRFPLFLTSVLSLLTPVRFVIGLLGKHETQRPVQQSFRRLCVADQHDFASIGGRPVCTAPWASYPLRLTIKAVKSHLFM